MAGKAIAVRSNGKAPAFALNTDKFDPAKLAKRAAGFASATGGSIGGGGASRFPGEKYLFKKGWFKGLKARTPVDGVEVVVNVLKAGANWIKFEDKKPVYASAEMVMLSGDGEMKTREELGDLDEDEWDQDTSGKPMDPWRPVVVIPIRDEDDTVINHIDLSGKSAAMAGFNLFKEICESMPMHLGEMPVVRLGTKEASRDVTTVNKKGKESKQKQVWDVPEFTVIGWVPAQACDDPDAEITEASDDVGEVESRGRKAAPAVAAKATGKKRKVKAAAVADDDDDL